MSAAPRVLAIVPARGGSRGIPKKNLALVAGRSLLDRAVAAGLDARRVRRVVVSSDDDEILAAARRAGAEAIRRPPLLATDHARSEPVVAHAIEAVAPFVPDVVCLLQPTSPLRDADDVDEALRLLEGDPSLDAVLSVFEPRHSPYKAFRLDDGGCLAGVVDDDAPFRPRQELPLTFHPNGAVYAIRTEVFLRSGRLLGPRTAPYVMPRERSIDVDTPEDLARAEAYLAALRRIPQRRSKSLQKTTSASGSRS